MADRQRIRLACWLHQIWQQLSRAIHWTRIRVGACWLAVGKAFNSAASACQLAHQHGWLLCFQGFRLKMLRCSGRSGRHDHPVCELPIEPVAPQELTSVTGTRN